MPGVTRPAGTLQVPPTTSVAGWYTGSPRPGELGAAVIAGHVDSVSSPGVLFRLNLLRPHSLILVLRADHSLAAFRAVSVRTYAKSHFPTAAVYGPATSQSWTWSPAVAPSTPRPGTIPAM